jgi:hypothetical protein
VEHCVRVTGQSVAYRTRQYALFKQIFPVDKPGYAPQSLNPAGIAARVGCQEVLVQIYFHILVYIIQVYSIKNQV